jgi:hypothetical protein
VATGGGLFEIVNFDILKCCFLTIGILSNLSQSSGNGISPNQKELSILNFIFAVSGVELNR